MDDEVLKSLIAAVIGGFVGALGALWVQFLQNRAAERERREVRLVAVVQEFATAAMEWSQWLRAGYDNRRIPPDAVLDENNKRVRARSKALRSLQLHCTAEMLTWLKTVYAPAERDVKKLVGQPLRDALAEMAEVDAQRATEIEEALDLDPAAKKALDRYEELIGGELVERCRSEMKSLS